MKKHVLTAATGDPDTLAAWLAARLSVGAAQAAALIARGAVQVDGRRATDGSRALPAGTRVTVFVEPPRPSPSPVGAWKGEPAVDEAALRFAYQDGWLLVVDKPPGVPSQATRTDSASALDAQVQRAVPDARMMHRLDRDASGLVLFAAKAEARAPLQAALESGRIDRVYLALVAGRLDGEGRVALRIARDLSDERRRVALPEAAPGGQAAASRWRALAMGATATALELRLETGRTHQLRVHLAAIGHPILGDRLYGGPAAARLCLHATRLALPHPRDGRPVEVRSPPPPELPVDAPP